MALCRSTVLPHCLHPYGCPKERVSRRFAFTPFSFSAKPDLQEGWEAKQPPREPSRHLASNQREFFDDSGSPHAHPGSGNCIWTAPSWLKRRPWKTVLPTQPSGLPCVGSAFRSHRGLAGMPVCCTRSARAHRKHTGRVLTPAQRVDYGEPRSRWTLQALLLIRP